MQARRIRSTPLLCTLLVSLAAPVLPAQTQSLAERNRTWESQPVIGLPADGDDGDSATVLVPGDIVVLEQGSVTVSVTPASIIRVDPPSGTQTIVSEGGLLSNAIGQNPSGFVLDWPNQRFLVVDRARKLVSVNTTTGQQELLNASLPTISVPTAIAVEANGMLLVTDYAGSLIRLDSHGIFDSVVAEDGLIEEVAPYAIQVDDQGTIFIAALTSGGSDVPGPPSRVIRVNPETGQQHLLAESTTEQFRDFALNGSVAYIAIASRGYPSSNDRVATLDLSTGQITSIVMNLERALDVDLAVDIEGNLLILDQCLEQPCGPGSPTGDGVVFRWTAGSGLAVVTSGGFMNAPGRMLVVPEVPPAVPVQIDIKPGSDENPVNPLGNGLIPVAILGSDTFDVVDIDVTTLAFGPSEASPSHDIGGHWEDVDDDGMLDFVSHYRTRRTGIGVGDEEACLNGETLDGTAFNGCDTIMTVPE